MTEREFDRQITRLRNHFGERHYSSELVAIFWKSFSTLPDGAFTAIISECISTFSQSKPPLRNDIADAAKDYAYATPPKWEYITTADCLSCGGVGYYYAKSRDDGLVVLICEECNSGKNILKGPKGTLKVTKTQAPNCVYLCAGNENPERVQKH